MYVFSIYEINMKVSCNDIKSRPELAVQPFCNTPSTNIHSSSPYSYFRTLVSYILQLTSFDNIILHHIVSGPYTLICRPIGMEIESIDWSTHTRSIESTSCKTT